MAQPTIIDIQAVALEKLKKEVLKFGTIPIISSPFISKNSSLVFKQFAEYSEKLEKDMTIMPEVKKTKTKSNKQVDQAKSELLNMGYTSPKITYTKLTSSYLYEIRVEVSSPIFGKIIKIEHEKPDSVGGEDEALIWIWNEAKKRLIQGKVINEVKQTGQTKQKHSIIESGIYIPVSGA